MYKKIKNHEILSRSYEFSFITGNPIPAPNPMRTGMGRKSSYLLNGNGDEKALSGGEQTRCHPYIGTYPLGILLCKFYRKIALGHTS
jgi:hypothetical protein